MSSSCSSAINSRFISARCLVVQRGPVGSMFLLLAASILAEQSAKRWAEAEGGKRIGAEGEKVRGGD